MDADDDVSVRNNALTIFAVACCLPHTHDSLLERSPRARMFTILAARVQHSESNDLGTVPIPIPVWFRFCDKCQVRLSRFRDTNLSIKCIDTRTSVTERCERERHKDDGQQRDRVVQIIIERY